MRMDRTAWLAGISSCKLDASEVRSGESAQRHSSLSRSRLFLRAQRPTSRAILGFRAGDSCASFRVSEEGALSPGKKNVPILFFSFSYRFPSRLVRESITSKRKDLTMIETAPFAEDKVRPNLARLLNAAVNTSGRARCDLARDAEIHRDALRRTLAGDRPASLGEAMRILGASGVASRAHLILFLLGKEDQAVAWLNSDAAQFFGEFSSELPCALERALGNQLHDIKSRWAKGAAHRVARLLSDHIDELERKDAVFGDVFVNPKGGTHG